MSMYPQMAMPILVDPLLAKSVLNPARTEIGPVLNMYVSVVGELTISKLNVVALF